MTMIIDLKAARCPDATLYMTKSLEVFYHSEDSTLELSSIEPSMARNLKYRLAMLYPDYEITEVATRAITSDDIACWLEDFDEEGYESVSVVSTFTVKR
jgi:hypothetical protein